jgi:hypothetical protein
MIFILSSALLVNDYAAGWGYEKMADRKGCH